MKKDIFFRGIETNNLKNINVTIKKNALNLIIGPSGSGKSSLAYDTIAQIGLHEYMSMFNDNIGEITYKVAEYGNMSAAVPLRQSNHNRNVRSTIGTYFGLNSKMAVIYADILGLPESFFLLNKEANVCHCCRGLGYIEELDVSKIIDRKKPLKSNPFKCWQRYSDFYSKIIQKFCEENNIDVSKTFEELTLAEQELILYGESRRKYQISYKHGKGSSSRTTKYFGVMTKIPMRKGFELPKRFFGYVTCPECEGRKYSKEHMKYKINEISIGELMLISFDRLEKVLCELKDWTMNEKVRLLIQPCISFIRKANELNLKHLCLNRTIPTLSGGELQRLRLVQAFNSQLSDLVMVLDEPLAGLSGTEKETVYRNIMTMIPKHTLVVVDHSDLFVNSAENIIALGEGGGWTGGKTVNAGQYLEQQKCVVQLEKKPLKSKIHVEIEGRVHQYRGVDVSFALNRTNVISGPSGIGKTTLLKEYLPRFFEDYIYIDQKQAEGNQNSNVATLLGISAPLFRYFANTFGKDKDFFSNGSGKEGACPVCNGAGCLEYENYRLECGECGGTGFNGRLKMYKIAERSIFDIWDMTVDEAMIYFQVINKKIMKMLSAAQMLALGHLKIGQLTETLSGGENVRIKLLKLEGSRAGVVGIDEPFKGLNPTEIGTIMRYLTGLRERGKTVIVVDHTDTAKQYFDNSIEIGLKNAKIIEKNIGF